MENKKYLKEQIITYLGNKRSLLPYIEKEIISIQKKLNKKKSVNVDLFSGSGIVARVLKKYSSNIIVNDLEKYSETINKCYLSNNSEIKWDIYEKYKEKLDIIIANEEFISGIITENYAPKDDKNIEIGERVFYTNRNAKIIDTVRNEIEKFEEPYKTMFLAQLLTEASVKNNTAGVFKGFYKDSHTGIGKFGGNGEYALKRIKGEIKIEKPVLSNYETKVDIYREDSNVLVKKLKELDIVYIDPPYNQHPYGSNYFMLNLIVNNKKPEEVSKVSGIPKDWNKSVYNVKNRARDEFDRLIADLDAKYIIVSYNSEGFITHDEMRSLLEKYGVLEIKEIVYNTYRGSRNLSERNLYVNEYLFILSKKEK
jgi:adenine-specific DNA-methyltransferase